jgi:hypothetical protein
MLFGNGTGLDTHIYDTELEETTQLEVEFTKNPENTQENNDDYTQVPYFEGVNSPNSEESTQNNTKNNDNDRDCSNNASQPSQASQNKSIICKCYYCPAEFDTPEDHKKHSLNNHPNEPAQPDLDMIQTMREKWGRTDIEPKGNPWE